MAKHMSIPFLPYSSFLIITGAKGTGKTYLTKKLTKELTRYIVIDSTFEFTEFGYPVHYPFRIPKTFKEWHKIIYQPFKDDNDTWHQVFKKCRGLANYTLVINEIDTYTYGQWYISNHLKHIVRRGRIQGISLIANTRRPSLFHRDIRNSADIIVCFRLHEQDDLSYMSKWLNIDKQAIKTLEPYHSWLFITEGCKLTKLQPI